MVVRPRQCAARAGDRRLARAAERADPARRRSARRWLACATSPSTLTSASSRGTYHRRPCRCASSISTRRRWPNTASGRGRAPSWRRLVDKLTREGRRRHRLRRGVRRARPLVAQPHGAATSSPIPIPRPSQKLAAALQDNDEVLADAMAQSQRRDGLRLRPQWRHAAAAAHVRRRPSPATIPSQFLPCSSGTGEVRSPILEQAAKGNGSVNTDVEGVGDPPRADAVPARRPGRSVSGAVDRGAARRPGRPTYRDQVVGREQRTVVRRARPASSPSRPATSRCAPTRAAAWRSTTAAIAPERFVSASDVLKDEVPADKLEGQIVFVGTSAIGLKDLRNTPVAGLRARRRDPRPARRADAEQTFLERPDYRRRRGVPLSRRHRACSSCCCCRGCRPASMAIVAVGFIGIGVVVPWIVFAQYRAAVRSDLSAGDAGRDLCQRLGAGLHAGRARAAARSAAPSASICRPTRSSSRAQSRAAAARRRAARDHGDVHRRARLHAHLRAVRSARPDAVHEPLPDADDRPDPAPPRHDRQVHGRRHHGVLERAARPSSAMPRAPARRRSPCRRGCVALNEEWQAEAEAEGRQHIPVNIGVGLNTGHASVGNFGSTQRFTYSCLGDEVNLASRLEGQCKTYGVGIIIGDNTAEQVPDFATLELDLVMVKGKTEPERVFMPCWATRRGADAGVSRAGRPAGGVPGALSHRRLRRGAGDDRRPARRPRRARAGSRATTT